RRGNFFDLSVSAEQGGRMASVADGHSATFRGAAADQGCVLAGKRAVAEQAAGTLCELINAEAKRDEAAEYGVELGHQHRSGDSLSGNVAENKIEVVIFALDDVNVVAADHASRFVGIVEMPAVDPEVVAG